MLGALDHKLLLERSVHVGDVESELDADVGSLLRALGSTLWMHYQTCVQLRVIRRLDEGA